MRKFLLPATFAAVLAFGMMAPPRATAQWADQATVNRYGPAYNGGYSYYPAYRYPYVAPSVYVPPPVYYRANYYAPQTWDERRWNSWRQWDAMHGYRR